MGGTPGIYNFNSGTHCGRARGQATPCRVSPTPRDSSRGLKRKRQITIRDCTGSAHDYGGPKGAQFNLRTLEILLLFFLAVILGLDRRVLGRDGLLRNLRRDLLRRHRSNNKSWRVQMKLANDYKLLFWKIATDRE